MPRDMEKDFAHPEPKPEAMLASAILLLTREIGHSNRLRQQELDFYKSMAQLATKEDLKNLGDKIMSAITEFRDAMKAFNDEQSQDIDKILESVTGIDGDVTALDAKIQALQDQLNNSGTLSQEDKDALASVLADSSALRDKTTAAVTAAQALDAKTPPVAPAGS